MSTFNASETYGTSGSPTTTDTTYINLLSTNTASGSDLTTNPQAAPITIPGAGTAYSYERYIRGHWTSVGGTISNVVWWKQTGTIPGLTQWDIYGGDVGSQTFTTPVNTASSVATATVPTTSGGGYTLAYSTAYSDYVCLQLRVGTTASAGAINTMTYRWQWDET